ncbi:uncharacterized protein LOC129939856 [Eupeodes corollae]|uniref:uncharacterized protein LOC129939856 n=1 Tax=Eupeodes corollae TaxID=290404 RepID=UPI0024902073|nr:uncharacterized protein LOC129939856 [Eupeodes corollae]
MDKEDSCVETPAAPEWLSKLESRREKLVRGKLGHEAGAGAPCNDCGDKCPGLDLHFWRKVCRNCKCRKDLHMCPDDDLSGWAQFEILGQIRSKPAFMKIKALANQPVQLDWVPPNTTPDVVSDYMDKLGTTQIPVAGSDAAAKRKQQLEFQVPPHDLDAALCDNLTESETNQLQHYVQKIRENCVGQGNVVRVGNVMHGKLGHVAGVVQEDVPLSAQQIKAIEMLHELPSAITADPILVDILKSEILTSALVSEVACAYPKTFVAFSEPLSQDEMESAPVGIRQKVRELNKAAIISLVENGPIYDKILNNLKQKNLDVTRDLVLGPIADFRKEYVASPQFQHQVNSFVESFNPSQPQFCTPIKTRHDPADAFISPLPVKKPIQTKIGALMKQDTPMRKVKFGGVSVIYDLGLPIDAEYEKDQVFAKVVNSEQLKNALQMNPSHWRGKQVAISLSPLPPDFEDEPELSDDTKEKLKELGLNINALQSGIVNGPYYDKLFEALKEKGVEYANCKILAPIEGLREELLINKPFSDEVVRFVEHIPNSANIAYSENAPRIGVPGSRSCDSGFGSKPSTPNYATHPDLNAVDQDHSLFGMNASSGRFASIPGIEEMNMYPDVQPSAGFPSLNKSFDNLTLGPTPHASPSSLPVPILSCRDCETAIMSGEVAVKAERAGKEIAWHPECFKCHECRELLADLVYFFHGGNVYCGRDLAIILKIPRCKACDELIFTKEYTAAEGATFHIKHFCCYQCDTPLAGQQYIPDEKTNMPLCLKCYDTFFAEACQYCKQPIGPSDQGVAWGTVHWHGSCFICAGVGCAKSLIGGRFCVKNNMPFCSPACVKSVVN